MDRFLRSISYIFHPLFMPLLGVLYYFKISPRFIPEHIIQAKLVALLILTIILPILVYFLLKTLGKVKSVYLENTQERIFPLIVNGFIILIVIQRILTPDEIIELYYFFIGILISTMVCLILAIANFKASIHMIAATGVVMFCIILSIHFSVNINTILALMVVIIGLIATSRLHVNAHNYKELIMGCFIGVIPQLILVTYWL